VLVWLEGELRSIGHALAEGAEYCKRMRNDYRCKDGPFCGLWDLRGTTKLPLRPMGISTRASWRNTERLKLQGLNISSLQACSLDGLTLPQSAAY
jgi:hypothetical protein